MFNDLSLNSHYSDFIAFKEMFKEILCVYTTGKQNGHTVYLHRDAIYSVSICGLPFRTAIGDPRYITNDQKKQVLSILDKSTPILPDNSVITPELSFFYNAKEIKSSGLAECACQQYLDMDASVSSYSLSASDFRFTPLTIYIKENETLISEEKVKNIFSFADFKKEIASQQNPIESWDELFDFTATNFTLLEVTDEVKKSMQKVAFENILADRIIERFRVLNTMAESDSEAAFLELHEKYCEGCRAWFSDESDTRKRELEGKLTFQINGERVFCPYHGKINYRTFRIHISSSPKRHERIYIAYMGGKIT